MSRSIRSLSIGSDGAKSGCDSVVATGNPLKILEDSLEIDRRFCGPPRSANGGYVGGRLAAYLETEGAVAIRLFSPPPLDRRLVVRATDDGVGLFDGDTIVAAVRPIELDLEAPPAPSFEEAARAAKDFRGFDAHVFPACFVCGHERGEGDGLRIFPGPANDRGSLFAAPWIPDVSLCDPPDSTDPNVLPEFLWAALDCPGAFSFPQPEGKILLLGEMQVELTGTLEAGERCVLASWYIRRDGRKHLTGSAVYAEDGRLAGRAKGIWIELDPEAVPRS